MNENVRDMDDSLKDAISQFFKMELPEQYSGYCNDLTDDLEAYLKERGFDLGCVNQYKNNGT
jgi:nicotinamidase-related amidase